MRTVSELCIETEELCITNEEFCIINGKNGFSDDNSTIRREVAAVSQRMLSNVDAIRSALESSMTKDVIKGNGSSAPCHPYVAGVPECGMLPHPVSHRDSEAWRTYAEVMYSGALDNSTIREILLWHQTQQGHGVRGSRLKLGVLAGCGLDVSCGDQLETFTIHGWGWGLLQADLTEEYANCNKNTDFSRICALKMQK